MKPRNLFAYDKSGSVIVTAHGAELVVASGSDGAPLWNKTCKSEIVGVGSTEEEVVSLDAAGNLIWWNVEDGTENDRVSVAGKLLWLAVDADGVAGVIAGGSVHIVDPGDKTRELAVGGARRLAWSEDGARLAVGTRSGAVRVFDEETLEELGSSDLGASVTGLAFGGSALYATAGGSLYRMDADGDEAETMSLPDSGLDGGAHLLACSDDGSLIAVAIGAGAAIVLRADGELVASVRVPERELVGVALGPRPWLGIGADGADAARINLRTKSVKHLERAAGVPGAELRVELNVVSQLSPRTKKEARASRLPRTEREANAPDLQTLIYFGIVACMSLVLWGSARFACNAHPPTSLKPREVGTVELASRPKDAAIEMFQRLELRDFDGALQLAKGQSEAAVEKVRQECMANASRCEAERQARVGKVLTTADLISRDANTAKARVTSLVEGEPPRVYDVELEQDGPIWKVTRHALVS